MSSEQPTTIGRRLLRARLRAKLSQDEVAVALKATRQMVSAWEHDLAKPRMGHLAQACELYGCNMNEIMFGRMDTGLQGVVERLIFARPGAPDPCIKAPSCRLSPAP